MKTDINLSKIKDREISVLMGGWSSEREISLKTGEAVVDSIKSMGLNVRSIDLTSPDDCSKVVESLDLVFIALHGRGGEDGFIQSILEHLNIPYTHSGVISSSIAMDKVKSRIIFKKKKLNVPKYFILNKNEEFNFKKIYS